MNARGVRVHRVATDEKSFRRVLDDTRAAPNGEVAALEQRLQQFEAKYEMTSAEAKERVGNGTLPATQDVETWMMVLRVRDDLVQLKARTR